MSDAQKTVGRKRAQTGLDAANNLLKLVIELRGNKPFIPRGVYRFRSFEEAQTWSLEMMTRKSSSRDPQPSKTSSPSAEP